MSKLYDIFEDCALSEATSEGDVISNVRVATSGEAKGHGKFLDESTLDSIVKLGNKNKEGVAVDSNHSDDVKELVGTLSNFKKKGDAVFADMNFFENSPDRGYFKELSKKIPDQFGLSIWVDKPSEELGGKTFMRPSKLHGVGIVRRPAANESLLSEETNSNNKTIMEKELNSLLELVTENFKQQGDSIEKLSEKFSEFNKEKVKEPVEETEKKEPEESNRFNIEEAFSKLQGEVKTLTQKLEVKENAESSEALKLTQGQASEPKGTLDMWRENYSKALKN